MKDWRGEGGRESYEIFKNRVQLSKISFSLILEFCLVCMNSRFFVVDFLVVKIHGHDAEDGIGSVPDGVSHFVDGIIFSGIGSYHSILEEVDSS
jgi:hypothetical protein